MPGKVAIVTGANKGIGKEIVRFLCQNNTIKGADNGGVVILCSRNVELGNNAAKEISESGGIKPVVMQLDIANQNSIKSFVENVEKTYGGVDILVNNAGFAFKNAATDPFGTQARVTNDINFYGTVNFTEAIKKLIKPGGRIVFVSSTAGSLSNVQSKRDEFANVKSFDELKHLVEQFIESAQGGEESAFKAGFSKSAYGISKTAVSAYTRLLAKEIHDKESRENVPEKDRILVNCCCPGWCKTDMAGYERPPRTAVQGAETPVHLALLPPGAETGKFWSDNKIHPF